MKLISIYNFAKSVYDICKNKIKGNQILADFKDIESRIKICRLCTYKSNESLKNMKCSICECRIKYKVRYTTSSCPKGKWLPIKAK